MGMKSFKIRLRHAVIEERTMLRQAANCFTTGAVAEPVLMARCNKHPVEWQDYYDALGRS